MSETSLQRVILIDAHGHPFRVTQNTPQCDKQLESSLDGCKQSQGIITAIHILHVPGA